MTPHVRIGIDIGGTFTDLQVLDERGGALHGLKTPTTPEDPSIGLLAGLREAGERFGFALADIRLLLHGTTIATNAVLERRLPRGVLLTTAGFEDVLEIGRHGRRDVYGLRPHQEPPLIPRDRRLGLPERMRADGRAERALDAAAVDALLPRLDALEAEAVAVCLLHAHTNPAHERLVAERLRAARPELPVSLSSDISPEVREYERCSTTVLNALLMPVVGQYLDRLASVWRRRRWARGCCWCSPTAACAARTSPGDSRRGCCCRGRAAGRWPRCGCRTRWSGRTCSAWTWAAPPTTSAWCRAAP